MSEGEGAIQPKDIVSKVQGKGDTLDAIKRLTGRPRPGTLSLAGALSSPFAVEALNSDLGLQYLITHPAYSAFAGTLFGAMYGIGRMREKGKVAAAEELQQEFRDLTGEPVDLVRTQEKKWMGIRRKKGPVVMRWYGLDGMDGSVANTLGVKDRLEGLVEIAKLSGIDTITMGSSALRTILQAEGVLDSDFDKYGTLVDSSEFLADAKKITKLVIDKQADKKLLTASVAQCEELLKKLSNQGNVMQSLVGIIQDPGIAEVFSRWKLSGKEFARERLQSALASRMPGVLEEVRGSASLEGGKENPGGRTKHFSTYHIDDAGNFTRYGINHISTVSDPAESILGIFGLQSNQLDDLINSAVGQNVLPHRQERALVALYELVRRQNPDRQKAPVKEGGSQNLGEKTTTLYQRIPQEPPRTVPFLRKRGKGVTEETATIEYANTLRTKRILAAGLLTALMGGGAYGAAYAARVADNSLYQEASDKIPYSFDAQAQQSRRNEIQAQIAKDHPIGGVFDKGFNDVADFDARLQESIATAALNAGVPIDVLQQLGGSYIVDQKWLDKQQERFAGQPTVNTSPENKANTGDVNTESNVEIYHVIALGDQSVAGYWYNNVYNGIGTNNSMSPNYPFTDTAIEYRSVDNPLQEKQVSVQQDPNQVGQPLLFMVATPYINGGRVALPSKSGTQIVAARIIEKDHPEKSVPVKVFRNPTSGLYNAVVADSGFDLPVLEYYLASAPQDVIHAHGDMQFADWDNVGQQGISEQESTEVKAALGLPPTATDEEIKAAIHQKHYSYTPVADSGSKATEQGANQTIPQIMTEIAIKDAQLPEANCNTTSTLAIVARGGRGNIATGFSVDADGSMSQQGAHMWIVDGKGEIIDYTPSGEDPRHKPPEKPTIEQNPGDKALDEMKTGGELLLTGAGGVMFYRRRRQIKRAVERAIENHVRKTYFDDGSPNARNLQDAISIINTVLWSGPESSKMLFTRGTTEQPLRSRVTAFPPELTDDDWERIETYVSSNVDKTQFNVDGINDVLGRLQRDWKKVREIALNDKKKEDEETSQQKKAA